MEQDKAFVHCYEKILEIHLDGVTYFVNLMQGDLPDNWNSITDVIGKHWDVNLYWDEEEMDRPNLTIYSVDKDGVTNFSNSHTIPTLILGTKEEYFNQPLTLKSNG